jgi:hypothetical protein
MLPAGAVAVVLLVNYVQIMLPAPAFVQQGRTYAPARVVLQRLGYEVRWDPATRAMVVSGEGVTASFPEGAAPTVQGQLLDESLSARRVGDIFYLSLSALRGLGLRVHWEDSAKRAEISALGGRGAAQRVPLGFILADPVAWRGRAVTLTGEYLGWSAYPFSFATREGSPGRLGDWVLRNEDGAIYCSADLQPPASERPTLAGEAPTPFALTPYQPLGRRLTVTGLVRLSPAGTPYLEYQRLAPLAGAEGMLCLVEMDRHSYRPGGTLVVTLRLANTTGQRVVVRARGGRYSLSVGTPDDKLHMVHENLPALLSAEDQLQIEAGQDVTLVSSWQLPPTAIAGTYRVVARLGEGVSSYPAPFTVLEGREASFAGGTW